MSDEVRDEQRSERSTTPLLEPPEFTWDEEALFSRDVDGQLIRVDPVTYADFERKVEVKVDQQTVTVRAAVPRTDSQGNPVIGEDGRSIPRRTTVYDVIKVLYGRDKATDAVKILCHADHLKPVGVCRVCSVLAEKDDGKGRPPKLIPACCHPVIRQYPMIIHTRNSPDKRHRTRIDQAIGTLLELLASDHLQRRNGAFADESLPPASANREVSEFERLVDEFDIDSQRFASSSKASFIPLDQSSHLMVVDRQACILCNRCIRACNEVKQHNVISRSGKGYRAEIAFDLNNPLDPDSLHNLMRDSTCVSCGECMISCPTDALTLKPDRVCYSEWWKEKIAQRDVHHQVTADDLRNDKDKGHEIFRLVPPKFLTWNASAAVYSRLEPKYVLCEQFDHGSTAFILLNGRFGIFQQPELGRRQGKSRLGGIGGVLGRFFSSESHHTAEGDSSGGNSAALSDALVGLSPADADAMRARVAELERRYGPMIGVRTRDDFILGEMSCMNYQRRTATVVALDECQVIEIRRNILYMLQRVPETRRRLQEIYRRRVLGTELRKLEFIRDLDPGQQQECERFLQGCAELVHVDSGQVIFEQDDDADAMFLIRYGHVKVTQRFGGREIVLDYMRAGQHFGELGVARSIPDLAESFREAGLSSARLGARTATCTALDHVELVRINKRDFEKLLADNDALRHRFARYVETLLTRNKLLRSDAGHRTGTSLPLREFVDQGLYNAQKLLILDLDRCTRCDECTKACIDTHKDHRPRLIRDGLRFGGYLIASACRSCEDPYCLVGCPVDAIHRGARGEITIEDHCIGCGVCADNCPYGNINMLVDEAGIQERREASGETIRVLPQRATTCDLCASVPGVGEEGEVSCVRACPHEAAFRVSGEQLYAHLYQQCVGIVIDDKGDVLLNLSAQSESGFPSQRPRLGESPQEAAVRAVREQTGYVVQVIKRLSTTLPSPEGEQVYFLMRPDSHTWLRNPLKSRSFGWHSSQDAIERMRAPDDLDGSYPDSGGGRSESSTSQQRASSNRQRDLLILETALAEHAYRTADQAPGTAENAT